MSKCIAARPVLLFAAPPSGCAFHVPILRRIESASKFEDLIVAAAYAAPAVRRTIKTKTFEGKS
jgi:hypothetical protein